MQIEHSKFNGYVSILNTGKLETTQMHLKLEKNFLKKKQSFELID